MSQYALYYPLLTKVEGGFSNRATDRGGLTYHGVTYKNFPTWLGWAIINRLAIQLFGSINNVPQGYIFKDAQLDKLIYSFYLQYFWDKYKIGHIDNQSLANLMCDWMINGGAGSQSLKDYQSYVGTYPDGIWGINSSKALNSFASNKTKAEIAFNALKNQREKYYRSLSDFNVNGNGWLNRLSNFTFTFAKENKTALILGVATISVTAGYLFYNRNQKQAA